VAATVPFGAHNFLAGGEGKGKGKERGRRGEEEEEEEADVVYTREALEHQKARTPSDFTIRTYAGLPHAAHRLAQLNLGNRPVLSTRAILKWVER